MESGDAMSEVGTLKELGVQVGDVVEYVSGSIYHDSWIGTVWNTAMDGDVLVVETHGGHNIVSGCRWIYRIISRATPPLRTWAELTPAEKGALLLAHHQGEVIEWSYNLPWKTQNDTNTGIIVWSNLCYYRIKPQPKIEAVTMFWAYEKGGKDGYAHPKNNSATHRITFQTIDGKPDCASVKMEEV